MGEHAAPLNRLLVSLLTQGFHDDVDGFLQFSLSVQNRRKSRVGFALENHMEVIFTEVGIKYERAAISEDAQNQTFFFRGAKNIAILNMIQYF